MSIIAVANQFFAACETGRGWEGCRDYCHLEASFSAQADSLAEITTLSAYCDWMKGLLVPIPDGNYKLNTVAVDDERQVAMAFAVFRGTHTIEGPVPPTGSSVAADYVYAMEFEDDKIRHMTKIWNDGHSLRQLGWA